MLLTDSVKLDPTPEQAALLLDTMRAVNAGATDAAAAGLTNRTAVHAASYYPMRERHGLPGRMATRAIDKAIRAVKVIKGRQIKFRPFGAIDYDGRCLTWRDNEVSILTLAGRSIVPHSGERVTGFRRRDQCKLVYRDGNFYLLVAIEVPEPEVVKATEWLGVDLGLVNIATDSDGHAYSGRGLRNVRRRNRALRAKLQAKGTKSAKRLLKKRRRKESRHARDINHCISKELVGKAKGTGRGIALEDLKGIRDRITVRKAQRADHTSWAFAQLRTFIEYKAKLAGVEVAIVDPRNTSRECPECGTVDKRNRPSQAKFCCVECGFAAPADATAARNIAGRAAAVQPHAA